jgi:hypothetical protein
MSSLMSTENYFTSTAYVDTYKSCRSDMSSGRFFV